jgi:hypothetical protein
VTWRELQTAASDYYDGAGLSKAGMQSLDLGPTVDLRTLAHEGRFADLFAPLSKRR